jgi:hypothetical protein
MEASLQCNSRHSTDEKVGDEQRIANDKTEWNNPLHSLLIIHRTVAVPCRHSCAVTLFSTVPSSALAATSDDFINMQLSNQTDCFFLARFSVVSDRSQVVPPGVVVGGVVCTVQRHGACAHAHVYMHQHSAVICLLLLYSIFYCIITYVYQLVLVVVHCTACRSFQILSDCQWKN